MSATAPAPATVAQTHARNDNSDASRYRLTIEAVGKNRYVYKVLDRVTGEVIRQLPREDVEKLAVDPTYRQGKVVDTSA
ncbi:flagellar protein FlaG [Brevundimonas sp. SH203]|uniref:flagellar protein FlaG n=1 Tax=Brevundimonas sp. SH203 TaxID=345167 RepID=UPI000B35220F|nr:flagellar protein FlaG [Brevundimonas sp. SH203]